MANKKQRKAEKSKKKKKERDKRQSEYLKRRTSGGKAPVRPSFAESDLPDSIEARVAERGVDSPELSEDEAYDIALEMHPELEELSLADKLPSYFVDESGQEWSPRMHLTSHAIVERQIHNDTPPGIQELAIRFERDGKLNAHLIKHAMALATMHEMYDLQKGEAQSSDSQFLKNVENCYEEAVRALWRAT